MLAKTDWVNVYIDQNRKEKDRLLIGGVMNMVLSQEVDRGNDYDDVFLYTNVQLFIKLDSRVFDGYVMKYEQQIVSQNMWKIHTE